MRAWIPIIAAPVLALPFAAPSAEPSAEPSAAVSAKPAALHCQVPCGIYGDTLRIDLLMEDAQTIEKAMGAIEGFEAEESPSINQMVRWTTTKEDHAQKVQDQVSAYWLAQRIQIPADDADEATRADYLRQLELLHHVTVDAMKCKQTTDTAHVAALRETLLEFSGTYFDEEDLEHVRAHHGAHGE